MAHLMDGGLTFEPRWTGGSAFVLDLPAAELGGAEVARGSQTATGLSLAGLAVLLVEDRADTRQAMTQLLRQHGAEVASFANSREVAAALETGLRPAAVITDWHLDHEDSGAEVVALVRRHAPAAQVLVMSGDATLATEKQVAASGCPLLLKPLPEQAVLAALAALAQARTAAKD
jgi:DNA-binding NtrC family response regulator